MARIARLGVVIDSSGAKRGAQEVQSSLKGIESSAQRAVSELKKAGAALGIAIGVKGLAEAVDSYTLLNGRLKQVTGSSQEFAKAQSALFQIAQSSRQSYAATVDLYARMARSSDALGLSQTQLISITEAVSNATRLSNASTGAAAAGIMQLGQAFASGVLRGDELNSIMEQLPAVAQAIADGLGVPIGKLREMGAAGELSGRQVALALESQKEKLALLAKEIPTTIGAALTQLNNAFGMVVAGSNEAKSATGAIAAAIGVSAQFLLEYKDAVVAVSVALGAGGLTLAATKAGAALLAPSGAASISAFAAQAAAVTSLSGALTLMRAAAAGAWAALLGPVGAAIAAVTIVTGAVYAWRKSHKELTPAINETTKAIIEQREAAEKAAKANYVPPNMVKDIEAAGMALAMFRQGGKAAADGFKAANDVWKDASEKNRTFAQALAEGDQKAQGMLKTATALTMMNGQLEQATERQTKATQDAAKAAKERGDAIRDYEARWVLLTIELADRAMKRQEAYTAAITEGAAALATSEAARLRENAQLRAQIAALNEGGVAYSKLRQQQELQAGVAEALTAATKAGIALTPLTIAGIVQQVAEYQRLKRVRDALLGVEVKGSMALPPSTLTDTNAWVDGLRDVLGVAQLIAQAFGEVGKTVSAVATGAQSITTGLVRAQSIKNGVGESVSFGDALGGKAGAAGTFAALGAAGAVLGGITQVADALDLFGTKAREKARQMAEAAIAFNRALEDFAIVARTSLDGALRQNLARAEELIKGAAAATGIKTGGLRLDSADDLRAQIAQLSGIADFAAKRGQNGFANYRAELERVLEVVVANEAALREQNARELARLNEDLTVRRLVAAGQTEAADAERLRLQQLREIAEVESRFGADSPYLVQLRAVQVAETQAAEAARLRVEAERAATQAREREAFGLDITARRQSLSGDTRGAFATGQTISANNALAQAQALVAAGTITGEMFEQLKVLIGDEMTAALRAFDAAAAEATRQQVEDLSVRKLVAEGRTIEAEQMRIDIANRRELAGVTDASMITQIQYVQELEAVARATAAAAEQQQLAASQNADIDRRMLDVYRSLDPAKARELERKQTEIDRTQEIASAVDESTRARLRELHAMEDAAAAAAEVTKAYQQQAEAAAALADFTRSIDVQYKRSQGRNFDADVTELNEWRDNQKRQATLVGASADVFSQIDAIYAARYQALIAATMEKATTPTTSDAGVGGTPSEVYRGGSPERITTLGEETTAVRSARSISEASALQLVDYAASSAASLRRLVALVEGKGAGGALSGRDTAEEFDRPLSKKQMNQVDRYLGIKGQRSALLINGRII